MTPTDRMDAWQAGQAIPVAANAVENELAKMWRAMAETCADPADPSSCAVTRACLWNLIVRTCGGGAFVEAKRLVDEISPTLPARVIVVNTDATAAASPVKASIEANWHKGGKGQIGSEEITLEAAGEAVRDVAPIVRSLLLPDVPTAAVWHCARLQAHDAVDEELLVAAQRLVLDTPGDTASLAALAQFAVGPRARLRRGVDATSIGWLHATPWRVAVAELFDPPCAPEEPFAVERVLVRAAPSMRNAALLFVGWLADRLGWTRARRDGAGYAFDGRRGAVTVRIEDASPATDVLEDVELGTQAGAYHVGHIDAHSVVLETPETARREPRHSPTVSALWVDALGSRGRDAMFVRALAAIAPIL